MKLDDFDYKLPKEYIAQAPIKNRSDSKLMVLHDDYITHKQFYDLIDYLEKGDVLVVNESVVIPGKLTGKKETGGQIEAIITRKLGLFHEAMVKGRVNVGDMLIFEDLSATVESKKGGLVKLKFTPDLDDAILADKGELPIPPYVKRKLKEPERYQTVYGKKEGSLAAHTAGLHFTHEMLAKIKEKGVKIAKVCLHISYATFLPIRGDIREHMMAPEYCSIDKKNADIITNRKKKLFAVGTTTVKTLESLATREGVIEPRETYSDLFIYPSYKFKVKIDGLITNFHLPKSTLLLMICAYFGKERILHAYEVAKQNNYRFFSFGDAMMLLASNEYLHPQ